MKKRDPIIKVPTRAEAEAHLRATLPIRPAASHKGSFGRAHLFVGSDTYGGAALLAAEGALRMGAGLTYLYTTPSAAAAARARLPELIITETTPAAAAGEDIFRLALDVEGSILLGPGLGQTDENGAPVDPVHFCEFLSALLSHVGGPIVLDADALNLLSRGTPDTAALLRARVREVIITPHPTEFARLFGRKPSPATDERIVCASIFAAQSGTTVLLKGADTVIASPDGRATVNPSGSSALAKGGTGDVLAGMLTALLAQGMSAYDAACAAAYLHGAAGDTLAATLSEYGVLPSELPAAAARELARILEK